MRERSGESEESQYRTSSVTSEDGSDRTLRQEYGSSDSRKSDRNEREETKRTSSSGADVLRSSLTFDSPS